MLKKRRKNDKDEEQKLRGKNVKGMFMTGRALLKFDENLFKNKEEEGSDGDEEEKYVKKDKEEEGVIELTFGLDEEEAELDKEIAKAKMNIDEELFDEDADDVDLDDLE